MVSLPQRDSATYMHRVGRTGRFGTRGVAVCMVGGAELAQLRAYLAEVGGGAWAKGRGAGKSQAEQQVAILQDRDFECNGAGRGRDREGQNAVCCICKTYRTEGQRDRETGVMIEGTARGRESGRAKGGNSQGL